MSSLSNKISLKYDGLFGGSVEEDEIKNAQEIALDELHEFKNHPFIVRDDEKLQEMIESIKKVGILNPAIARKDPNGGYELISGHTRKEAAKRAGLATMPVIVRDYDNDMATIAMVDSNLQREELLISEKAKAYAMRYEAIKHQGSNQGSSLQAMSEETGEGYKTIQRLINLSYLSDDLLNLVDQKKLGITQGLDLTTLSKEEQTLVYADMIETDIKPSMKQTKKIKDLSAEGKLDEYVIHEILSKPIVSQQPKQSKKNENTYDEKSIEAAIKQIFENTGILSYNAENDRYGIKMGNEWINTGFHCGDRLRAFINGCWVDTRMEYSLEKEWYLVGTEFIGNLENIIVRI
ncbi:MAG: ParB/RepB/Spo0J family partition protein [Eubacterium sp.]|nr:ParB/RepB/Spo0J family partition protein [Eubacterium sp.]